VKNVIIAKKGVCELRKNSIQEKRGEGIAGDTRGGGGGSFATGGSVRDIKTLSLEETERINGGSDSENGEDLSLIVGYTCHNWGGKLKRAEPPKAVLGSNPEKGRGVRAARERIRWVEIPDEKEQQAKILFAGREKEV